MVTLRPFIRMNAIGPEESERFVQAVAGAKLSVREIELLAHGYFRGAPSLRRAVDEGRWKWTLDQMQAVGGRSSVAMPPKAYDLNSEPYVCHLLNLRVKLRTHPQPTAPIKNA
jgi:hypothetical protein